MSRPTLWLARIFLFVIAMVPITAFAVLGCSHFWDTRPGYKAPVACPSVPVGAEVACDAVDDGNHDCYSCENVHECYLPNGNFCSKNNFCTECVPKEHFGSKRPPDAGPK